jgi:hypothetical protein
MSVEKSEGQQSRILQMDIHPSSPQSKIADFKENGRIVFTLTVSEYASVQDAGVIPADTQVFLQFGDKQYVISLEESLDVIPALMPFDPNQQRFITALEAQIRGIAEQKGQTQDLFKAKNIYMSSSILVDILRQINMSDLWTAANRE